MVPVSADQVVLIYGKVLECPEVRHESTGDQCHRQISQQVRQMRSPTSTQFAAHAPSVNAFPANSAGVVNVRVIITLARDRRRLCLSAPFLWPPYVIGGHYIFAL